MTVSDLAKHRFMEACKTAGTVAFPDGSFLLRIGDYVIEMRVPSSEPQLLDWLVEALRGGKA